MAVVQNAKDERISKRNGYHPDPVRESMVEAFFVWKTVTEFETDLTGNIIVRSQRRAKRRNDVDQAKKFRTELKVAMARRQAGFADPPVVPEKENVVQKQGDEKIVKHSASRHVKACGFWKKLYTGILGNPEHHRSTEDYTKEDCNVYQTNIARQVASDFLTGLYGTCSAPVSKQTVVNTRCKKDKFNKTLEELQVFKTNKEVIEHLCMDTAGLDTLINRAMENQLNSKKNGTFRVVHFND